MNKITIELCAEDRARLDRLTAALENAQPAELYIDNAEVSASTTEAPTTAQEPPKEEPQTSDAPTPENATQPEPESEAPVVEAQPEVTLEQIQQKVVQIAAIGATKKEKVRAVINAYGAKVSDLKDKPEAWGTVWSQLLAIEKEVQ